MGGLKEAQRTLEETLAWPARYPQLLGQVKMRLRSGVLLYGPPGSGKTLLAHTVAATCKLNFITVKVCIFEVVRLMFSILPFDICTLH